MEDGVVVQEGGAGRRNIGGRGVSPTGKSFRFVRRARTVWMPSEIWVRNVVWPFSLFPFRLDGGFPFTLLT